MGKVKKGVKKFQKKQAGGAVHKKKKLHFKRDNAKAAQAAQAAQEAELVQKLKGANVCPHLPHQHLQSDATRVQPRGNLQGHSVRSVSCRACCESQESRERN